MKRFWLDMDPRTQGLVVAAAIAAVVVGGCLLLWLEIGDPCQRATMVGPVLLSCAN